MVVLPRRLAKFRKSEDRYYETPSCFLPTKALTSCTDPTGRDSSIFLEWMRRLVEETNDLGRKHKYIFLTLDDYGAHWSFQALNVIMENHIFAIGLPAQRSHRTQVLDYSVLSPFKNKLRNLLIDRAIAQNSELNDVYTTSKSLAKA